MKIPFTNLVIGTTNETRSSSNNAFLSGAWQSSKVNSGVSVTKENSLSIAGVYSAVKVITDSISSLPIHVMKESGNTKLKDTSHPVYPLLSREPNSLMTSFVWRQIIVPHILLWGNAYCIIEFAKGSYRPLSILPVHPSKVEVEIIDGVLMYTFKLESKTFTLDQSNVLHFRGMGNDVMGKSVIDVAAENLGLGKASEQFGSKFFGNGASMTGVLSTDSSLSDKAFTNLRTSFNDLHSGIANANKPLILEEGLKYTSTSIPPDSAQFLETRRFSIEDIARWFSIPPDKIGDLSRATFSNLEQQNLNYVTNTLLPLTINIEEELNRKMLRDNEKNTTYFKLNLDGLLRGDISTRVDSYAKLIQNGVMTPNEARTKEGMNPLEGLDNTWMQINTAPVVDGTNQNNESNEES